MIAEQLRKSILQAAIQGKLTEQLPEDGDARDLLKEIQKEKARLIKEGKIKKEKPLPEITEDEIPFEIPGNWCWVRLNECLDVRDGTHDTPKYVSKGIPLVTSKNLVNGSIDFSTARVISVEDAEAINLRSKVDDGDILFAMIGSIGNPAIVRKDREFSIKNVALFKNISSLMNMRFVYYFLFCTQDVMKKVSSGGVQAFISLNFLRKSLIPIPPAVEQQRIVERLEQILPELDKLYQYEAKLEALQKAFPKKMKDSLLQYAIQGKLTEQIPEDGDARDLLKEIEKEKARLIKEGKIKKEKPLPEITEDEIPFEIPDNWCWVRLGEISQILNGDRGKNYPGKEHWTGTGVPFINAGCLDDKYLAEVNFNYISESRYQMLSNGFIEKGDILYCLRGSLGKMSINRNYDRGAIASSLSIIRLFIWETIEFVYAVLNSNYGAELIKKVNNGTAQPNLSAKNVENYVIPLPPLAEQQRIVERLDELLPLCETLE